MGKLSALSVKAIAKPGRHGDGDGLCLNVATSGTKSWGQRIVIYDVNRVVAAARRPDCAARVPEFLHGLGRRTVAGVIGVC